MVNAIPCVLLIAQHHQHHHFIIQHGILRARGASPHIVCTPISFSNLRAGRGGRGRKPAKPLKAGWFL
jgi:hypothetical protein